MNLLKFVDAELLVEEQEDPRYANSPFRYIKRLQAKQKGKRYEAITRSVMKKLGFNIQSPESSDHDMLVDGERVEIKGSTLNKGTDRFSFLQIRPDQEYDKMYFTMCYPDELVIMEMDKATILENIRLKHFKKQHGGNKANSRTYLYYGNKETLEQIGATFIYG